MSLKSAEISIAGILLSTYWDNFSALAAWGSAEKTNSTLSDNSSRILISVFSRWGKTSDRSFPALLLPVADTNFNSGCEYTSLAISAPA